MKLAKLASFKSGAAVDRLIVVEVVCGTPLLNGAVEKIGPTRRMLLGLEKKRSVENSTWNVSAPTWLVQTGWMVRILTAVELADGVVIVAGTTGVTILDMTGSVSMQIVVLLPVPPPPPPTPPPPPVPPLLLPVVDTRSITAET